MSVSISFEDLRLADDLKGLNSIQLLDPFMDSRVKACLAQIGFDIEQPIFYEPSKHRCMNKKVVIDYQAVGEMSKDRKFLPFWDTYQRTVLAGMSDISLGKEMAMLQGRTNMYKNSDETESTRRKPDDVRYFTNEQLLALGFTGDEEEEKDPYEGQYIETDWEATARAIQQLVDVRDAIRGKQ